MELGRIESGSLDRIQICFFLLLLFKMGSPFADRELENRWKIERELSLSLSLSELAILLRTVT